MKILDEKQIGQALRPARPGKVETASDDFSKVLSEIRSKSSPPAENTPLQIDTVEKECPRLGTSSALERLNAQSFSLSSYQNESSAVKRVENLLDVLESYSRALADPGKNLRDIAPLIKSMEGEREKLAGLAESLPDGTVIKDLVNKAAILSAVEALKFNRGDYL